MGGVLCPGFPRLIPPQVEGMKWGDLSPKGLHTRDPVRRVGPPARVPRDPAGYKVESQDCSEASQGMGSEDAGYGCPAGALFNCWNFA